MKKSLLSTVLFLGLMVPVFAQIQPSFQPVMTAYLEIKDALTADDGKAAVDKAATLVKALGEMPMDKMTPEQHTVWMKYVEKLKFDAQHISETKDAGHQRDHFSTLSGNLFEVAKVFKANDKEVYQQYCPMKKAYWLSESKTIKNPYYGKKMLTCGKVTATLPAN